MYFLIDNNNRVNILEKQEKFIKQKIQEEES